MSKKPMPQVVLPDPQVVLPDPQVIYINSEYRVVERPRVIKRTQDGRPVSFQLELIVEINSPDALRLPAWAYVGTERSLCEDDSITYIAWRAFFSVIRGIPRAGMV